MSRADLSISDDVNNNGSLTVIGDITTGSVWSTKDSTLYANGTQVLGGSDPLFTIESANGELLVRDGYYCVRETNKGESEDTGTSNVVITLNKDLTIASGEQLAVKNAGTLALDSGVTVTVQSGGTLLLRENAKISNVDSDPSIDGTSFSSGTITATAWSQTTTGVTITANS